LDEGTVFLTTKNTEITEKGGGKVRTERTDRTDGGGSDESDEWGWWRVKPRMAEVRREARGAGREVENGARGGGGLTADAAGDGCD